MSQGKRGTGQDHGGLLSWTLDFISAISLLFHGILTFPSHWVSNLMTGFAAIIKSLDCEARLLGLTFKPPLPRSSGFIFLICKMGMILLMPLGQCIEVLAHLLAGVLPDCTTRPLQDAHVPRAWPFPVYPSYFFSFHLAS